MYITKYYNNLQIVFVGDKFSTKHGKVHVQPWHGIFITLAQLSFMLHMQQQLLTNIHNKNANMAIHRCMSKIFPFLQEMER